ncbi:hypothetical protein PR002_g32640 [Phytophthora rubi]|uniref:Uncharacterized protein n=1 Tax=Phytophthora rubi TaxID=129364 RepID=A0A6A3G6M0_9STRA|nr:hypothetical protein PR002_g32640 [Phytophthora rubi]
MKKNTVEQWLPCEKNAVEQRLPYENQAVEQRLPYEKNAVEQGLPHVKNAVEQRLPLENATVEQRLPFADDSVAQQDLRDTGMRILIQRDFGLEQWLEATEEVQAQPIRTPPSAPEVYRGRPGSVERDPQRRRVFGGLSEPGSRD